MSATRRAAARELERAAGREPAPGAEPTGARVASGNGPWWTRPPHSGVPPRTPGCVRCLRYGGDHAGECIASWEEVGA
jgi:hypothetical protein